MTVNRAPIGSTLKDSEDGMFATVHGTSEQRGIGVAQSRRAAGLPTDNGFTEANHAKFRLIGILVIEVILFAALGESAGASDDLQEAFAAMESIAGIVFAIIMAVTWILLAVAVKAHFGKRRRSPRKDPL
jgi:hypothetical protein